MASLSGRIETMGVLEILRVPIQSKKDGELILVGERGEARFYFQNGRLIKAVCGGKNAAEALSEIQAWGEGEFEFRESEVDSSEAQAGVHEGLLQLIKSYYASRVSSQKKSVGSGADTTDNNLVKFPNKSKSDSEKPLPAGCGIARFDGSGKIIGGRGVFNDKDAAIASLAIESLKAVGKDLKLGDVKSFELRGENDRWLAVQISGEEIIGVVAPAETDLKGLLKNFG